MKIEDLRALFKSRWEAVSGEFASPIDGLDPYKGLAEFLQRAQVRSVVTGGAPLAPAYVAAMAEKLTLLMDFGQPVESHTAAIEACRSAEAGVHSVDALIADTGTLVVASRHIGDRMVSALPPLSVAVVKEAPLYETLAQFLNQADKSLSYTFITGPSRTADIEKRLVLGVHGPLRTVIWGMDDLDKVD
ncbi:MAG: hypothetical protein FJY65_00245 [Calditrichaeota bacterium]|nr:hypothetical protein [Calditrichota bacterium]